MSVLSSVWLAGAIIMFIGASLLVLACRCVPRNTLDRPAERERLRAVTGPALLVGLASFVVYPNWFLAVVVFGLARWFAMSQQDCELASRSSVKTY